ncbi:MAG: hypothetical protein EHM39_10505, partial [Chloroflexi bacterium]
VNDRRLMDAQVQALGAPAEKRGEIFHLIDRRDKLRPEDWEAYALESGLTREQLEQLKGMLEDPELWRKSPELCRFFAALDALGVRDYVQFAAGVIRGLDYYTGTVFEAREREEGGRAILGGGRYDNLVSDVGGQPVNAVGYAMGDVMLSLVLKKYGLMPTGAPSPAPVLVTVFDESRVVNALAMATRLREAGLNVTSFNEAVKLPKQLKYADKIGARIVVLAGPDEEAAGQVTVKDLARHEQVTVARDALVETVQQMLATPAGT